MENHPDHPPSTGSVSLEDPPIDRPHSHPSHSTDSFVLQPIYPSQALSTVDSEPQPAFSVEEITSRIGPGSSDPHSLPRSPGRPYYTVSP